MFRINEVISVEGIAYRILAEQQDEIVWISLDDEAAFPSVISRLILLDAIDIKTKMSTTAEPAIRRHTDQTERLSPRR